MNMELELCVVEVDMGFKVNRLGKSFKNCFVVRGVSLSVSWGEVVGLLGLNGVGKMICFYMIMGLILVDYGIIEVDG